MKRSTAVPLALVTAVAAAMLTCKGKPTRYCVDGNNVVVKDEDCEDPHWTSAGAHWYYLGGHHQVPPGVRVSGGTTAVPSAGFTEANAGSTVRGGIGEAGEAASGHGGAGEGGGE